MLLIEKPKYKGRYRNHCSYCGRFVSIKDSHIIYDNYMGGYEADPHCPDGKGCRKQLQ